MRHSGRLSGKQILLILGMIICLILVESNAASLAKDSAKGKKVALTYEKDILPIFRAKCFRCHAGVEPKGGLNLSQPSALLIGGDSGAAIRISAAESSLLYEKVTSGEMPAAGQKLTAKEKGVIRTWINDGAKGIKPATTVDRSDDVTGVELWSFNPPARPPTPAVTAQQRVSNPIDAFILRKLEEHQLTLQPEADRLTLLRRASFDLIGLPPSPEEIKQFLDDQRPDAYARMIDRLLASPHYGERWGRHWLDVAGYTDSAGILSSDLPLPLAYRYRDYVIRAFNKDKPYDRFLQEQIAGDELTDYWTAYNTQDTLPEEVVEGITATGFLRTAADASRPDFSSIKNAAGQYFYPTMFDTLQIVCSSTMGLTVQCARCHSHKFDPVPQVDYYRMQAVFTGAYRPTDWVPQMNRRLKIASKKQKQSADKINAEVDKQVKQLKAGFEKYKQGLADQIFAKRLTALPEQIRDDVEIAFAVSKENRSEIQKYLFEKFEKQLRPDVKELYQAFKANFPEYVIKGKALNDQVAAAEKRRIHFDEVRALYDLPGSVTTPVLLRGDPQTPGPNVEPGVITTIDTPEPFSWTPPPKDTPTSGRRLAFARWLTQPEHPLTARVMVNRIWLHHFSTGIVSTPEDFGVSGSPPSHPELLDWLATEFVRNGWSIKHMHRLILTSSTWRQRSRVSPETRQAGTAIDPENRLLWRQNMQRLQAEPLRDAVLATSGLLDPTMFGAPIAVQRLKSGEVIVPVKSAPDRRSIYIQILRLNPQTMLRAFDQPEMTVNCTNRSTSTVSTQALTLLNSDPMVRAANAFAKRVQTEQPEDPTGRAVLAAFSRPITSDERELFTEFLEEQTAKHLATHSSKEQQKPEIIKQSKQLALADLCHMLLSANEFAYID
ncbi:PSD1 and planctomycete cytochrome C domain-containing protein [Gimesia panareensis]|uniref:PSD1 and planctomycete cytochrome C domain-containing protein n=1 Tax=Gimesia panareensis TaxID=2527978 RepID=UPI00118C42EB|nr:PSD1 and planctomycete cytochrome C domain-containing protein [Gimesia panareensis]QDU49033.1 Planctomycete cytochrome C [Gimesia panareensis]